MSQVLTPEEIRNYCMAKYDTLRDFPFGETPECFKAGGMIYAQLNPDPQNYKITLRCDPDTAYYYRQQYEGIVVRGYHCPPVQQPFYNTVFIDRIDGIILLDMIDLAYEQVMKKITNKKYIQLIKGITQKELVEQGGIYLENIQQGFDSSKYETKMLEGNADRLLKQVKEMREENGLEHSYVDFYYGTLLPEEKQNIRTGLSEEGRNILDSMYFRDKVLFLQLTDPLLALTAELNEKELLFCTWYFCKSRSCVWGNYDRRYPVFTLCNTKAKKNVAMETKNEAVTAKSETVETKNEAVTAENETVETKNEAVMTKNENGDGKE